MKYLKKQQILSSKDTVSEDVKTPEWAPDVNEDGSPLTPEQRDEYGVKVRSLTGEGRGVFIQESIEMKKKEENKEKVSFQIEMLLVAMTVVDENGEAQFTADDVHELGQKNAAVIARIAAVAQRISGLDKVAQEAAAKNSPPAQS